MSREEQLLQRPPEAVAERFFRDLFATGVGAGLTVRHTSDMGRGVFAEVDFKEGDVVLQEPPLVSMQHSHNRARALVCSHCLRFIGPLEQAVSRLLTWQKGMREEEEGEADEEEDQEEAKEEKEEKKGEEGQEDESPGARAAERFIEHLSSGQLKLPHAECVGALPSAVPCPGGCTQETFCSSICATSAWADGHAMLCLGHDSRAKDTESLKAFYTHADGEAMLMLRVYGRCKVVLEAWTPFAVGHKAVWWEAVACPPDVEAGSSEESSFRACMKSMAEEVWWSLSNCSLKP
ncbi:unnamed protein product [Closterium sp. Yama58-4]|nr:unnamed protein product [Closterium sp. Yama58-4]